MHREIQSDAFTVCCETRRIILSQFDFAQYIKPEGSVSKVGATCWMAPEILLGKRYKQEVDVWSFGVVMLELINGEPPHIQESQ